MNSAPMVGRSRYRPLYIDSGEGQFLILVIAPEAIVSPQGFRRAIDRARRIAQDDYGIEL